MIDTNNLNQYGKYDESKRNFETRVEFIRDIFTNKFDKTTIIASSIKYKLGKSYDNYVKELTSSVWSLKGEDPIKILKKIDRY